MSNQIYRKYDVCIKNIIVTLVDLKRVGCVHHDDMCLYIRENGDQGVCIILKYLASTTILFPFTIQQFNRKKIDKYKNKIIQIDGFFIFVFHFL